MRSLALFSLALACLAVPPAASAQQPDAARGALLYENHCTVCHESTVHVREDRRVRTEAELAAMVTRWARHLDLGWTAAELADVRAYLDGRYYRTGAGTP